MKVYLSSTYKDLRVHREQVGTTLRKAQYQVVMMEEYVARDETVEFASTGDVSGCDAYVGLFAWRYGYVPKENNPLRKSITELEYDAAAQYSIPRLTFLVKDDAPWPQSDMDADCARISELRSRLTSRCAAYFSDAEGLVGEVLAALRVAETTTFAKQIEAIDVVRKAQEFGPSYMANISDKFRSLLDTEFVEIQVGPVPWWNTRIHLLAALTQDCGRTREFVFIDADRRFLAMASPAEVRRRMSARWPLLESAYARFRVDKPTTTDIEHCLWRYPEAVAEVFGASEESKVEIIQIRDLQRDLGIIQDSETVDMSNQGRVALQREILGRRTPFAVLPRDDRLEGLVEISELSKLVARKALERVQSA